MPIFFGIQASDMPASTSSDTILLISSMLYKLQPNSKVSHFLKAIHNAISYIHLPRIVENLSSNLTKFFESNSQPIAVITKMVKVRNTPTDINLRWLNAF
jgi:hypothetical protein